MWSSLAVLLVISGLCFADKPLTEVNEKPQKETPPVCGRPAGSIRRDRRMVGGLLAPNVPWQALVSLRGDLVRGGGVLISDRWVLTSGRNLMDSFSNATEKELPRVYVGITELRHANHSAEVPVEKVIMHPRFQNSSEWENDLALIKLGEKVSLGQNVMPICLPLKEYVETGREGHVAGFGMGAYFEYSKHLKYLMLAVADHAQCHDYYNSSAHLLRNVPVLNENMFCTEVTRFSENTCWGDAGAAFAVQDPQDGAWYLAGILSFDKSCSVETYSVFMKLSSYLPWIYHILGNY